MKFIYLLSLCMFLSACAATPKMERQIQRLEVQNDVETLTKFAKSAPKNKRLAAIKALGNLRDPRAVQVLSQALKSKSWVEREAACVSLGKLRDSVAIPALITVLIDSNRFVKEAAAKSLSDIVIAMIKRKDLRFYKPLLDGLRENNYVTRIEIEKSLNAAIPMLRKLENRAFIKPLVVAIQDDNRNVREVAARALGEIRNPNAMPALIDAQADRDVVVSDLATEGLLKIKDLRAIGPLIEALSDSSANVRQGATDALVTYTDEQSVESLIKALSNKQSLIRIGAAKILGLIENQQAINPLLTLLNDADSDVRLAAGNALDSLAWSPGTDDEKAQFCVAMKDWLECEAIGKPSIKPLVVALADKKSSVRENAGTVLDQLAWVPGSDKERGMYCVAKRAWDECISLGKPAIEPLFQEVANGELLVQRHAINTLGKINQTDIIKRFRDIFPHKPPTIRQEIVIALGNFEETEVFLALIESLDDKNRSVREKAATVLRGKVNVMHKYQNQEVISALIRALKDNNRTVRIVAAELLGEIKNPEATKSLIIALGDSDSEVTRIAADALPKITDSKAIGPLVEALKNRDPKIRLQSIKILGQFRDHRALDPLLETLNDYDPKIRSEVIIVLAGMSDPRINKKIVERLRDDDPKVRATAVKVLAGFGSSNFNDKIADLLEDTSLPVREAAAEALENTNWKPRGKKQRSLYYVAIHDWEKCLELGRAAVLPLNAALESNESEYKVEIARTLGQIGDMRAIDALINAWLAVRWSEDKVYAKDIVKSVRLALGKFGNKAKPVLVGSLTNWHINKYAARVLRFNGWVPRTDQELIHFQVANRADDQLKANWPLTKKVLLDDVESKSIDVMQNALYALIGLGREEIVANLLAILSDKGTAKLAEAYLNSGQKKMVLAARSWASDRGLAVDKYSRGEQPVSWGKLNTKR